VYSDSRVVDFVQDHFVPVRVHVKQNADEYKRLAARFNAQWTPTVLIVDGDGTERHRIEGFLPADDFLGQLTLGLAKSAFARGNFTGAEPLYRSIVDQYPDTDAAPEALYWAGVSRYKATGDGSALGETAKAFSSRYTDTSWAKKASVWKA
jgi:TolA-binding protein